MAFPFNTMEKDALRKKYFALRIKLVSEDMAWKADNNLDYKETDTHSHSHCHGVRTEPAQVMRVNHHTISVVTGEPGCHSKVWKYGLRHINMPCVHSRFSLVFVVCCVSTAAKCTKCSQGRKAVSSMTCIRRRQKVSASRLSNAWLEMTPPSAVQCAIRRWT